MLLVSKITSCNCPQLCPHAVENRIQTRLELQICFFESTRVLPLLRLGVTTAPNSGSASGPAVPCRMTYNGFLFALFGKPVYSPGAEVSADHYKDVRFGERRMAPAAHLRGRADRPGGGC